MDAVTIKLAVDVVNFAFRLFNWPSHSLPQQSIEPVAPIIFNRSTDPDAMNPLVYQVAEKEYCDQVSAQEWKELGQPIYDAYEGHHSKSSVCKSLVMAKNFKRRS